LSSKIIYIVTYSEQKASNELEASIIYKIQGTDKTA